MNCFKITAYLALLLASLATAPAQERAGKIEFSDSNVLSGLISLTPGSELKLEAGPQIRTLSLDRVREIRFAPEKEEMGRAWPLTE